MKPGTRITLKRLPKNNGRAQLWITMNSSHRRSMQLKILEPSGTVHTYFSYEDWDYGFWLDQNTGSMDRARYFALKASLEFVDKTFFGGYL